MKTSSKNGKFTIELNVKDVMVLEDVLALAHRRISTEWTNSTDPFLVGMYNQLCDFTCGLSRLCMRFEEGKEWEFPDRDAE